jgi:hypothetical protein
MVFEAQSVSPPTIDQGLVAIGEPSGSRNMNKLCRRSACGLPSVGQAAQAVEIVRTCLRAYPKVEAPTRLAASAEAIFGITRD